MSQTPRTFAFGIIVLVVTTIIMFLIAEVTVRTFFVQGKDVVLFPRYHTDVQYGDFTLRRIIPHAEFWHTSSDGSWRFVTNKQGFRNEKDFDYTKPAGTVRILSLGDSHTQGYEVRQNFTFSAIIEKYLSRQGINAEVMNAGVSGFSTAEELLLLENEGVRYSPDFVVLGLYANDFQDNLKAGLFKLKNDNTLAVNKHEHIPGVRIQNFIYRMPFIKYLSENSYFYSLLFNNVWEYFKKRMGKEAALRAVEYAVPTQEKFSQYEIALTSALLKRMYDFCHQRNIKLIVLDIPRIGELYGTIDSSIPAEMVPLVRRQSDAYLSSSSLLVDYEGAVELHVPHGHRHISEFTHSILGIAAGKRIQEFIALNSINRDK